MLNGLARPALQQLGHHLLQPAAAAAFLQMQQAAAHDGISLTIASSYRDFTTQARIWRAKLAGERPVYDNMEQLVDIQQFSERDKLYTILHFSALPGTSRHHWGTDLDVFDSAAISEDYKLQLTPAEYAATGPFYRAERWLHLHAKNFGFFRPYRQYNGGVAAEPWHLSYAPLAKNYLQQLTEQQVLNACQSAQLVAFSLLKAEISEIMQRFVFNICEGIDE